VKEQNLRLRRELDGVKKRLTEQEQVTSQNRADLATRLEELSLQLVHKQVHNLPSQT